MTFSEEEIRREIMQPAHPWWRVMLADAVAIIDAERAAREQFGIQLGVGLPGEDNPRMLIAGCHESIHRVIDLIEGGKEECRLRRKAESERDALRERVAHLEIYAQHHPNCLDHMGADCICGLEPRKDKA